MTKKEISELKKLFKKDGGCITRICGCYVGNEKDKITTFREAFYSLQEEDTFKYYEGEQFENLIRPVENTTIMNAVCRRLGLEEASVEQEARDKNKEHSGKKRILVVDDNGTALRTIKAMLEDTYEVALAISGVQAMTSIGKKRPDLILLDYEMPVCDGKMTLEMIRADEELTSIPVVFLTAINNRENIEAVLKLKPAGYFLKPPVKERLLQEIEKILNETP